jgi:hypothetical protein
MGCLRDHSAAKDTDSNRVSGLFHAFSTTVWQTKENRNSFAFVSSDIIFVLDELWLKKCFDCVSICAGKSQIFAILPIKIKGVQPPCRLCRLRRLGQSNQIEMGSFSFDHKKLE